MLTPEKLLEYSENSLLTEALDRFEYNQLLELARIIAESEKYFTDQEKKLTIQNFLGSAEWQIYLNTAINDNRDKMFRELDRINKKVPGWTKEIFERAGLEAYTYQSKVFLNAYEKGLTPRPPVDFAASPEIQRIIEAGIEQTAGELDNFTRTTASRSNLNLHSALTQAHLQYTTGAFSRENAIKNALTRLYGDNDNIMRVVEYPSGHKDFLDVAVRRAIIGGLNITTSQVNKDLGERYEAPLVETSGHIGARDTGTGYENHLEWQARLYSYMGRAPEYPDFEESCGYEGNQPGKYNGKGILGYGCRHSYFFTFPDYPRAYDPADYIKPDVEWKGKQYSFYKATQLQRQKEQRIKMLKRQLIVHNQVLTVTKNDDLYSSEYASFQAAAVRLKKAESGLKMFCEETGLEYQSSRVQLYGFDRSVSMRAVQANRKYQKGRQ